MADEQTMVEMSDNEDFDRAQAFFSQACLRGVEYSRYYPGASYFTRIEAAYNAISLAWADVRAANMSPADRAAWKSLLARAALSEDKPTPATPTKRGGEG